MAVEDEVISKIEQKKEDVKIFSPVTKFFRYKSLEDCDMYEVSIPLSGCDYPPSQTEQIHAASISEQIRAGQGNAETPENSPDDYLFKDGRDTGVEDIPVFGDINEPASRFELEQKFKKDLSKSVQTQIEGRMREQKAKSTSNPSDSQITSQKPDINGSDGQAHQDNASKQ